MQFCGAARKFNTSQSMWPMISRSGMAKCELSYHRKIMPCTNKGSGHTGVGFFVHRCCRLIVRSWLLLYMYMCTW